MNSISVSKTLNIIRTELSTILDGRTAPYVLAQAVSMTEQTFGHYREYVGKTHYRSDIVQEGWGFSIRRQPLQFAPTTISDYPFRVDLTCDLRWTDEANKGPVKSNITVRLWAHQDGMVFRQGLDAENLKDLGQRVMLRFHFDLADPKQMAPTHHLQIGGVADANENCWLHEKIVKPRFPHMPMDLVLVCELIAATFFESEFRRIRRSHGWISIMRDSQEALFREYLDGCIQALDSGDSVLADYLWQYPS